MKVVKIVCLLAGALVLAGYSARAALVINEVCYDNESLADEKGDTTSDWIELYNTGTTGLNIYNYAVGDANPFEEAKAVSLPNYTIPPGGYLVVFASPDKPEYTAWTNAPDLDVIPPNSIWRYTTSFNGPAATWKTNTFNDTAWASGIAPLGYNDPKLNMDCATVLNYGTEPANRFPAAYFRKTFRIVNPSAVTGLVVRARMTDGAVVYLNGHEVMRTSMPGGAITHQTLALADALTTTWKTNLLPPTRLVRGANLLAVEVHHAAPSSPDLIMDLNLTALVSERVPVVHGQFNLANEGENVHLFDTTLARIQNFQGPGYEIGENKSWGLRTNGVTGFVRVFDKATPGSPNPAVLRKSETLTGQKPRFSVPPGVYAGNKNVVLSTPTAGYRIYYTTDGTDPAYSTTYVVSGGAVSLTAASPATSGLSWIRTSPYEMPGEVEIANTAWLPPLGTVAKAVVLRAVAVSADHLYCSPEERGTYFLGPQFTNRNLPMVSLITDENNLFGFTAGIYLPGKYYADSPEGYGLNKWGKPHANYHQNGSEWERPVHFELFETNAATAAISQLLGATMHGGGTRALPQKALYMHARLGEYGTDRVNYPLFSDRTNTSYKRFLLRTSGNDWYGPDSGFATMLKDSVFHRIVKNLDISVMAYRPTAAYINGEYWGIHNLREVYDKHYLGTRYGLEPDNCDILMHEDAPAPLPFEIKAVEGPTNSIADYEALMLWVQTNPPNIAANYAKLQATSFPNYTNQAFQHCTGMDVTNYADYIITEMFFGNTDWPVNNCDFWRARTNQVAKCGNYGDTRWRWMLYDLDVAGQEGSAYNMFNYLYSLRGYNQPGFLINQLWTSVEFRNHFVGRYVNLLNSTFRPERMAGVISQAADAIAPGIETHFRRWGRSYSQAQWLQAVNWLVQYTASRHGYSWLHLNNHWGLGGTGTLIVRNNDPSGVGGRFTVNGLVIDTTTDGVTDRAAWSGTFFSNLQVPVQAVPDLGYEFDGWVATTNMNPMRNLTVGWDPVTVVARFRPVSAPPRVPTGFERWQVGNYAEQEILDGAAAPDAFSGYAGMSNFELYAFGMSRYDWLSDEQRLARASLSITNGSSGVWVGYTRLNDDFSDIRYTLQVSLDPFTPPPWSNAVVGLDLDPVSITNELDASTWFYQVRIPTTRPNPNARFFKLEASPR